MKKILILISLALLFVIIISSAALAQEENQAIEQAKAYDFEEIESIIDEKAFEYGSDIDFESVLNNNLNQSSSLEINSILKKFLELFIGEICNQSDILRNIFIICILSGIFKAFSDSFKTKEISELGFYVCYITVVLLLIDSFGVGLAILKELVVFISDIARASAPVLAAIMLGCGEITAGGIISPIIIIAMNLTLDFISYFFIPGIKLAAIISIVNYLSNKEMLQKLSEFLSVGLSALLKLGAFVFMSLVSINKITSSATDNAFSKTAQMGINAVPIIGDVFSSAAENIMSWSMFLKTGVGVSIIIVCVVISIVPIVKILSIMLLYKLTAIVIEPFCDKRITGCIDTIGGYMLMILSAATAILIMFMFAIIIVVSAIGG